MQFTGIINNTKTYEKKQRLLRTLTLLIFLISGIPKLSVKLGFPLYAIDIILFYLILKTKKSILPIYSHNGRFIIKVIGIYLCFIILGECRGIITYGFISQHIYLICRFFLVVSISKLIPKLITQLEDLKLVMKGLYIGLLLSSLLSILYSIPFTRGIVNFFLSIPFLEPAAEQLVDGDEFYDNVYDGAYRGRTLIGSSTFSSGVIAALYPMLFMGSQFFSGEKLWRNIHRVSIMIIPLGILATYGRTAWLSVVLIILSTLFWGEKKFKAKILGIIMMLLLIFFGGLLNTQSISSNLPLVNRIVSKTEVTLDKPLEGSSEQERFLAYVQPFDHVLVYPSFLIAGSGITQRRWGGNKYAEAVAANHAIPGMAYYAYGVGGALCQIILMFSSFNLIYKRLHQTKRWKIPMVGIWQALLTAWFGLLPWWAFGHGIVSAPRGAAVFFLFLGILLACENIYQIQFQEKKENLLNQVKENKFN